MFLPHFDVICDLLLNRRMAAWPRGQNPRRQPRSPRVKRENMSIGRYCIEESNLDLINRARKAVSVLLNRARKVVSVLFTEFARCSDWR